MKDLRNAFLIFFILYMIYHIHMASSASNKKFFTTDTKTVNITFEYMNKMAGNYKGQHKVIHVTSKVDFNKILDELIPNVVIVQSPNDFSMFGITKTFVSQFRPRRAKSKSVKRSRKPRRQ
jgi:hypothetical protein